MAKRSSTSSLYDPRSGGQSIRVQSLKLEAKLNDLARTNYFAVYLIESGSGTFWADTSCFSFHADSLLFFVPYQRIRFTPETPVRARVIQFHANFLCIETFHAEAGCSGILFNDPYCIPLLELDEPTKSKVVDLIKRMSREQDSQEVAYDEVLLACLKVLLIDATRLKTRCSTQCRPGAFDPRHPTLVELHDLIETHYQTLHAPADYASRLHVTAKTLGRIVREHLGTTPTELIRGRILIHAKWQLLHTLKPVKEISRELGFSDELYFSRLFKKATGYSPTFFRNFETEIRGGSNLSMLSSNPPIQHPAATLDS